MTSKANTNACVVIGIVYVLIMNDATTTEHAKAGSEFTRMHTCGIPKPPSDENSHTSLH